MNSIRLRDIVDECFQDYYKPAMLLATTTCNWKCLVEQGLSTSLCQNMPLCENPIVEVPYEEIAQRYLTNPITHALVIGGLEPMLQQDEVFGLIQYLRSHNITDDIVIYTGYYPDEIVETIDKLGELSNIIVKFGRYTPGHNPHFDQTLGVKLVSDNQYAIRIS